MPITGLTATVGLSSTAFAANVISVSGWQNTKSSVDTSHLGTTNYRTKLPVNLIEAGDISWTCDMPLTTADTVETAFAAGTIETITVTFQDSVSGAGGGQTYTASGFLSAFGCDGVEIDSRVTATMTFTPDGVGTEPTYTDET